MRAVFDYLTEALKDYEDTEYTEVIFDLSFDGVSQMVGFKCPNGSTRFFDAFSPDGLTYILYRLGDYVMTDGFKSVPAARRHARTLYNKRRHKFVEFVNKQRQLQAADHPKRREQVLRVASNGNIVEGVLTNYNPVAHRDVVQWVSASPISARMSAFELSPKTLTMFFHSRYLTKGSVSFGFAVQNGETGHVSLSYSLYVKSEDYVFFVPIKMRRRHLSRVTDVVNVLPRILEIAENIEIDQILANTLGEVFLPKLSSKKFDSIRPILDGYAARSADDLVTRLCDMQSEHKRKTVANAALGIVFKHAFSLISTQGV